MDSAQHGRTHTSAAPAGTACIGFAKHELWPRGQDVRVVACRTICSDALVSSPSLQRLCKLVPLVEIMHINIHDVFYTTTSTNRRTAVAATAATIIAAMIVSTAYSRGRYNLHCAASSGITTSDPPGGKHSSPRPLLPASKALVSRFRCNRVERFAKH